MAYQFIDGTITDGVATITLNRPEVLNSFNRAMASELQLTLGAVGKDPGIRAILLTGAGRAFCAGQDLAEAVPPDAPPPDLGDIVKSGYNPLVRLVRTIEKPVICAVNGVAAGAGANLALACDILIAAEEASFIQSFSKIGLIPDTGGTFFLPRLVGLHRATAMMFLAEKITAARAKELGLVHEVVPLTVLHETAFSMARSLASQPTRGFGLTKRALNRSLGSDLDSQLEYEEELQREAGRTHDYEEGVRAFLEKRKPQFTGR
jgi:2-(1,2-epoxy-1,2-dihydrophenyl)acetyl-CoA isomerase